MKKIIKMIGLFGCFAFLLSGCGTKSLKEYYKKSTIGDRMTSYIAEVRLFGMHSDQKKNDIVRIYNYQNRQFQILDNATNQIGVSDNALYLFDQNYYRMKEDQYYAVEEKSIYHDPDIYLQTLLHLSSYEEKGKETIGEQEYQVFDIKVQKNFLKKVLEYTSLGNLSVKKDVPGKVLVDKDHFVYSIELDLKDALPSENSLILSVSYFNRNGVREIDYQNSADRNLSDEDQNEEQNMEQLPELLV